MAQWMQSAVNAMDDVGVKNDPNFLGVTIYDYTDTNKIYDRITEDVNNILEKLNLYDNKILNELETEDFYKSPLKNDFEYNLEYLQRYQFFDFCIKTKLYRRPEFYLVSRRFLIILKIYQQYKNTDIIINDSVLENIVTQVDTSYPVTSGATKYEALALEIDNIILPEYSFDIKFNSLEFMNHPTDSHPILLRV